MELLIQGKSSAVQFRKSLFDELFPEKAESGRKGIKKKLRMLHSLVFSKKYVRITRLDSDSV